MLGKIKISFHIPNKRFLKYLLDLNNKICLVSFLVAEAFIFRMK